MTKINILIIDDNPTYTLCPLRKISGAPDGLDRNDQIPWISSFLRTGKDSIEEQLEGIENLFQLKWLQFHNDAYEFRKLTSMVSDLYGKEAYSENGFVPDIIVFDYALTDMNPDNPSETINLLKNPILNEFINPNVKLAKFISEKQESEYLLPQNRDYVDESTINDPEIENLDLLSDSYGLYCGTLITELFRYDTPVASLPVTKKEEGVVKAEPEASFVEWFVGNSYYDVFKRKGRTTKDWKSILEDALKIYRSNLLEKLKNKIISIDLNNIISLLDCFSSKTEIEELKSKNLRFKSVYGWRELPLNGLFIDCKVERNWDSNEKSEKVDEFDKGITQIEKEIGSVNRSRKPNKDKLLSELQERKEKLGNEKRVFNSLSERQFRIWVFLNDLLRQVNTTNQEINSILQVSNMLWETYLNTFEKRIELSHIKKHYSSFNPTDKKYADERLLELKKTFPLIIKNGKEEIDSNSAVSISTETKKYSPSIIRMAILHLATQVNIRFSLKRRNENNVLFSELNDFEIFSLLFPISNIGKKNPIILPIDDDESFTKKVETNLKAIEYYLEETTPEIKRSNFLQLDWAGEGEKRIIQSLFSEYDLNLLPQFIK